ncbi:urea ABC transporter permease subunit UrtC [Thermus islandicus]|uniref:urea ABC transporter permease subunit UrtC n=1 Tax=Thermus islandicus TaxID=540988 RepID=UPI0003B3C8A0|nr:urea ABC transporter permease subunit UrtC [Thermus islandicus]
MRANAAFLVRILGPGALALLALGPFWLSSYDLSLVGRFLSLSLAAIGLVWVWGYGGVLSLGQGIFFGLGGYALAMHLKLASLPVGELPDFMVWNGLTQLPWWWAPFRNPYFALTMVFLLPALLALVLGFLLFRRRITGAYISLITQALALTFATLLISQQGLTGGFNGLTNFSLFLGHSVGEPEFQKALYWFTLTGVVLALGLSYLLKASFFGRVLLAIREGENRMRFLGYDPALFKTAAFALGAILTGASGALFTLHVGVISPAMVGVVPSIEMVIWTALGGRESFLGAVGGTVILNLVKDRVSSAFPSAWSYLLGLLFVLVALAPALGERARGLRARQHPEARVPEVRSRG